MVTQSPVIGVTLGDPTGVGPEVLRAALHGAPPPPEVTLRLYAPSSMVPKDWPGQVSVVAEAAAPCLAGVPSAAADVVAMDALRAAAADAASGELAALLTGPVSKSIFDHLDPRPPGQTEYLAARLGAPRFAMMLGGSRLKVVPVTTHCALKDVPALLQTTSIIDATLAAGEELERWFGVAQPRIAVAGLNPHAGEGGRLGDEESRVIAPAIERLAALKPHWDFHGPLPADIVFYRAYGGSFDLVVCMYHDQALGPLKLVHFSDGWNLTCGLPVPRISPDHGTAWDIAGRGVADSTSTREALNIAVQIATSRIP